MGNGTETSLMKQAQCGGKEGTTPQLQEQHLMFTGPFLARLPKSK